MAASETRAKTALSSSAIFLFIMNEEGFLFGKIKKVTDRYLNISNRMGNQLFANQKCLIAIK